MKVVFFGIGKEDADALRAQLSGVEAVFEEKNLTEATVSIARDAEIISVFVGSAVTKEIIDALPKLQCISTRSVGFDHIDTVYAKSRGISVCTVPAYGTHTVAEFAFALILALARNLIAANNRLHDEGSFQQDGLMGFDLFGKTLGVVGTGKIGKNVVRMGRAFGMQVLCHDPFPDAAFATEVGATYVELSELLADADVVSLHAPHTPQTHHLINATNISTMKKSALLVNTARGELIETRALVAALASGTLAGAGLDVFEGEREHAIDAQLLHSPRVIATPHVAYFTNEAKVEILRVTAENILAHIAGAPQNRVAY